MHPEPDKQLRESSNPEQPVIGRGATRAHQVHTAAKRCSPVQSKDWLVRQTRGPTATGYSNDLLI